MLKKVIIIDKVHPVIIRKLEKHGFACDYFPDINKNEIDSLIAAYFGLVVRSKITLDRDFLSKATQLGFIGRVGAGMENIDTEYAESKGIRCFNSPEGNRDAVGEHTLGLLLSLLNHLNRADLQVREGKWLREENRGSEIKGKVVGIIGYGNMGSAFAQRLKGFEAEVISYDKYKTGYTDGNTRETTLEEVFEKSDIVSMHIPLSRETRFLCDTEFFTRFRNNIVFINTSRGPILKTEDLVEMIRMGKVTGAALDVLEYESSSFEGLPDPYPEALKFLMNSDKVVFTPHIAGWTSESESKLASVLAGKIIHAFPS